MPTARWNGQIIAQTQEHELVEGNIYFPPQSIRREFFKESPTHTTCAWKGEASYYSVVVDGKTNEDAAWFYATPKDAAKNITNHVAFWKGVEVSKD
jgi:uncharacterized protein (DUF427 family)